MLCSASASILCEHIENHLVSEAVAISDSDMISLIGIKPSPGASTAALYRWLLLLQYFRLRSCRHLACPGLAPSNIPDVICRAPFDYCLGDVVRMTQSRVSCIMPTYGRPDFVAQSVAMFLAQDYAEKELIILNDCPGRY